MDNKRIWIFLLICLALVCPVLADITEVTPTIPPVFVNASTTNQTELNSHTYTIHRITQGEVVYLGDHLDITGVVAGNLALAWWPSGEPNSWEAPQVITLPIQMAGWYDFYIDPATFSDRLGMWYKWNGALEPNGNTEAFFVTAQFRNNTMSFPNGTIMNTSEIVSGNYSPAVVPTPQMLPEKHVADIIAVRGQSFNITTAGPSKLWMFGRDDGIYDLTFPDGNVTVDGHRIASIATGAYTALIIYPGPNAFFETLFDPILDNLYSPLRNIPNVTLFGASPQVAINEVETFISNETNDTYETKSVQVQDPIIQIVSMSQVSTGSAAEYFMQDMSGNVTLYDIRGYTNVKPGTNMSFALDEKEQTRVQWFNTTALPDGDNPGDMRVFEVYIPIYWTFISTGMHSITGYTDVGGSVEADFPVRSTPDTDAVVPTPTVMWVGDENPWKPNLTVLPPIVVTQTIKIIQTITIPVTPPPEEVKAAQDQVAWDHEIFYITYGSAIIICLVALFIVGRFLYRARKRREWFGK